ncbi:MAG: FkbM family methyltransferase [Gammaproteobacteria bacterium]|nr:FkbM family methyltransferase [Gammaproteobacteria bacterium]
MTQRVHNDYPAEALLKYHQVAERYFGKGYLGWYRMTFDRVVVYGDLMRRFGIAPKGMIYVGAHYAQLLWTWFALGFRRMLLVEPNPEVLRNMHPFVEAAREFMVAYDGFLDHETTTQIDLAACAVDAEDGERVLYVMSDTGLSSLLEPIESAFESQAKALGVGAFKVSREITVPVKSLDTILAQGRPHHEPEDFNSLYLNIQGAELRALQGARDTLGHLDFILLENNFIKRYEGCPEAEELDRFLADAGFDATWGQASPQLGNGMTCYVNRRPK